MSLGIARRSLDEMNKYATDREAFGRQIRDFGQMQRHIAESGPSTVQCAYIYDTANNIDRKTGQD